MNLSNNMNNKVGLKLLVNAHRISGQSYLFWNFGKRMGLSLKLVLIFLNTCLFVATLFSSYMNIEAARKMSMDKDFLTSHKTYMPYIIQMSVYICYAIINIYVFALIQTKGKTVLIFLYDMDINIDSKTEKNIALKVIILQVIVTFLIAVTFYLIIVLFYGIQNEILNNLNYLLIIMIILSNYLCLISMMAYFCYVIQQRLFDLRNELTTLTQLPRIFKKLLIVVSYVKEFDQIYNKYSFFMLFFYSFQCVSSLTILYFDRCKTMPWVLNAILESLVYIIIFCYLPDKIYKSFMCIIKKYEQLQLEISEINLAQFNHSLVSRLYSLRDDMCFTAFNLYPINMKTFMSILSLIITFSVILIQTHD